jgi:hypothetical protein
VSGVWYPQRIIALDPGEKHCGFAQFGYGTPNPSPQWHMNVTYELSPGEMFHLLETCKVPGTLVVFEEYRLYPWLLQEQGYSEVPTAERIGVIKYLCDKRRLAREQQSASIKKPTAGVMRVLGIEQTGPNQHCRDAEMHGWHFILNRLEWTP